MIEALIRMAGLLGEAGIALLAAPAPGAVPEFLWCSEGFLAATGFAGAGLAGQPLSVLLPPGSGAGLTEGSQALTHRDGSPLPGAARLAPLPCPGGEPVLALVLDGGLAAARAALTAEHAALVAERAALAAERAALAAEREDLTNHALLGQHSSDEILVVGQDGRTEWANRVFLVQRGLTLEDITGKRPAEFVGHMPGFRERFEESGRRVRNGEHLSFESCQTGVNGKESWWNVQMSPVFDADGNVVKTYAISRNVTRRKRAEIEREAERARAEAAEHQLVTAIEAIPDAFSLYDADDRLVRCNSAFRRQFEAFGVSVTGGMTFEALLDAAIAAGRYPEAAGREAEFRAARLAAHRNPVGEIEHRLSDDRHVRTLERRTEDGGIVCLRIDVTDLRREQRRIEAERQEHARLSVVAKYISDGVTILSADSRIEWANDAFLMRHGWTQAEVAGRRLRDILAGPELDSDRLAAARQDAASGKTVSVELRVHRRDRSAYWAELQMEAIFDSFGTLSNTILLVRDISGRKAAEDAVKAEKARTEAAETRLRLAIDAIPDAFTLFDAEDRLVVFNDAYARFLGPARERLRPGMTFAEITGLAFDSGLYTIEPHLREAFIAERVARHRTPGQPFEQQLADDRTVKIIECRTANGDLVGLRLDISELKRQQRETEAQRRQAERLSLVARYITDRVMILDSENRIEWANESFLTHYGVRLEDAVGQRPDLFIRNSELNSADLWDAHRQVTRGETVTLEFEFTRGDGSCGWSELQLVGIHDAEGRLTNTISLGSDISLRKQAEAAMHEALAKAEAAERRLRSAIDAIPDGFFLFDADDRLVLYNEPFRRLYEERGKPLRPGIRFEEILRESVADNAHVIPEGGEEAWIAARVAAHRNPTGAIEQVMNGNRYLRTIERRTADGDIVGLRVDVTEMQVERQRIEREREEHARLSIVARNITDFVMILGADNRIEWANDALLTAFGRSLEELAGRFSAEVLGGPDLDFGALLAAHARVVAGEPTGLELRFHRRGGDSMWIALNMLATFDSEGGLSKTICLGRDISQQKAAAAMIEAERAKAERAERRLSAAIEAIPDAFTLFDSDDRLVFCNQTYRDILQEAGHQVSIGMTFEEIVRGGVRNGVYILKPGEEEAWVATRLAAHRNPQGGFVVQRLSGDRYLRTLERRTADGDIVGFRTDVTELRREQMRIEAERAQFARLSMVARFISDSVTIMSPDGRIEWANDAFLRRYGKRLEEVVGLGTSEVIVHATNQPDIIADRHRRVAAGEALVQEIEVEGADGSTQWIELQLEGIFDETGTLTNIVGLGRDINKRKQAELAMQEEKRRAEAAEERLWAAIEAIPDAFVLYDSDDRLVMYNETYARLYAETGAAIAPGARFEDILRAGLARGQYAEAAGREDEWLAERLAAHRNPTGSQEQELPGDRYLKILERRTKNGDTVGFRVDITDLKRQQKHLENYAALLSAANTEIAQKNADLTRSQQEVQHTSLHDALTGLANRRYLDRMLQDVSGSASETGIALLHIDLDRFKQINDTLGHAAGDVVLREVARVLRETTRAGDFVARVGGDEFVVLCQAGIGRDDLSAMSERIIASMREPVEFEGHLCRFGASIGIAIAPPGPVNAPDLLVNADIALYRAKNNGRNCYEFFSEELQTELARRKRIADEIVVGLERGEFVPFYQPQFNLATLDVIGVEALARWHTADGQVYGPGHFLDIAKDLSLDATLDRVILEQALAHVNRWHDDGLGVPRVSVNVSARRLSDPDLIAGVTMLDIPPGRVVFELLESIYLDEPDGVVSWNLDMLRELGIDVELDDFGTGYASIISLVRISPHAIKIDQQLIRPIATSDTGLRLVESLVQIGRSLNVQVIAEGVETQAQAHLLRKLGCDAVQGNLFSGPLAEADLRRFLSGQAWRMAV